MITLALIAVASATEPVETAHLDRLIEATPAVEGMLAGPALPEAPIELEEASPTAVETVEVAPEVHPTIDEASEQNLEPTEEPGTPIDWSENGEGAVLAAPANASSSASAMSLVMVPVSLGLIGLVVFFRKRVFSQLPSAPTEVPMNVVARKATGNQSAIFLVDVADLEGGTRRLLVGSSPTGNNLIADLSPSHSIFPEPVFAEDEDASNEPLFSPKTRSTREERPALRAVEPRASSAKDLLDFGPKRALIDELISSSEKSSFRPRSVKKAYSDSTSVNSDPNSEEKRRAAQAVLDEVLAERRTGHRGTKVRVTA